MRKTPGLLLLAGCIVLTSCENAQERARYVKEPLEAADATSIASVHEAVREARTRLLDVRSRELRAELSKDVDDEYQRMLLQIRETERREKERAAAQAEKEHAAAELEVRREAMRLQKGRDAEQKDTDARHDRDAAQAIRDAEQADRDRSRQAVRDLQVGTRASLLGDATQVLILRNTKSIPAQFDLHCYTRGDTANKTFMVTVPPHGEKRVGFLQGWCGNFKSGERCEAWYDGELLWKRVIP